MEEQNPAPSPITQPVAPAPPIQPQESPQPEIPSTPNNPSRFPIKMVLLFTVLIVFLVIIVITGGMYYLSSKAKLSPSPASNAANAIPFGSPKPTGQAANPTADWKTYIDKNKTWTLKYPSYLSVEPYSDSNSINILFTNVTPIPDSDGVESGVYFVVGEYKKDSSQTFEIFVEEYFKDSPVEVPPYKKTAVNGITALTNTISQIDGNHDIVFIQKPENTDQVYYLDIYWGDNDEYRKLGSEILSTFKFTQ